jgi:hypothetical protein
MKLFVLGLPQSGRTALSNALVVDSPDRHYLNATDWLRSSFRASYLNEHPNHYEDEYQQYLTVKTLVSPLLVPDYLQGQIAKQPDKTLFVIDGLTSPKDFVSLFDFRKDAVLFVNRLDNEAPYRDHECIGVRVIKDYCYWMASAGLISKERWLEYNFRIPGEGAEYLKTMGAQNCVFITRSFDRTIEHAKQQIRNMK